jgi:hypothetical protein
MDFSKGTAFTNGFTETVTTLVGAGAGYSLLANTNPLDELIPNDPYAPAAAVLGITAGGVDAAGVVTESDIGTYLSSIELESAISNSKSSHIYSGVSTLASTVQLVTQHSAPVVSACTIDAFANFTILMSLNMRGTGVFSVSV